MLSSRLPNAGIIPFTRLINLVDFKTPEQHATRSNTSLLYQGQPALSLKSSSLRHQSTNRMPVFTKNEAEANLLLAQRLTFLLGQRRRHHSAQDHPVLKASRTQASAVPKVTCPPSHPQDS